jgi:hypothetical protein
VQVTDPGAGVSATGGPGENKTIHQEARPVRLAYQHQPTVLFSQNKPATSNQPTVLFSQNKSAPATSHQPTEQARRWEEILRCRKNDRENIKSQAFGVKQF